MELWTAFLIGLLGSLHCAGMCGPLALSLPGMQHSLTLTFFRSSLYNMGRASMYAVIGLLPGLLGMTFSLAGAQKWLSLFLGTILIIAAMVALGWMKRFYPQQSITVLETFVQRKMSAIFSRVGGPSYYLVGLVNGLLPCGLVYVAVAGALTQGATLDGALYMLFFGLGTMPMMFVIILSKKFWGVRIRRYTGTLMPYITLVFGILFLVRGVVVRLPEKLDTWFVMGFMQMCG